MKKHHYHPYLLKALKLQEVTNLLYSFATCTHVHIILPQLHLKRVPFTQKPQNAPHNSREQKPLPSPLTFFPSPTTHNSHGRLQLPQLSPHKSFWERRRRTNLNEKNSVSTTLCHRRTVGQSPVLSSSPHLHLPLGGRCVVPVLCVVPSLAQGT
ncbi:hypothetical protein PIB30_022540, partial [Stylosanthes scabra]|nr:hypothetical protein [Stylosanthes scabra]